jgi:asparagine synthase (glutamine-hydrolysing)
MCGIFGFVGPHRVAEGVDLDAITDSMKHRGPDARGMFRDAGPDVSCVFAHTRLAIIDLSKAGRQPMTTTDGRYTLVFNGEIYNFVKIRAELERSDVRFTSRTDSEVVLQSFAKWGPQCVERLRGIFAFAIWDRQTASLFLARDQVGVKPLYYGEINGGVAFASEVRTLMRAGLFERRMSKAGLASYLAYGSVQDPLTILEGISSLLPGHVAMYRNGNLVVKEYWSLSPALEENVTFDEAVERVRPILRDSVAMQLVADVPLGVFLSGGVDSSALVALASESSERPVQTFTVTFDESSYTEDRYAADIAQRFGCDHRRVHLPAERAADEFDKYVDALDQPSADGVNTYFVSQAAREAGLTVALSGTGGDEVFAGYSNFRRFGRLVTFGRLAQPFASLLSLFLGESIRARKLVAIAESGGDAAETYSILRAMFSSREVERLFHLLPPRATGITDQRTDSVGTYSRLEITHYLRNTLLRDTDVMSMAHSLEVRVPLLDVELLESVAAIPGALKMARSTNKPLLTAACSSLPAQVGARRKMGFVLPMDIWFRGSLRNRIADAIGRSRWLDGRSLWQSFLNRSKTVSWSRIWTIAALIEWSERNEVAI